MSMILDVQMAQMTTEQPKKKKADDNYTDKSSQDQENKK